MNTKYPNADTSPERLAFIEEFFEFAKEHLFTTLQKNEHDRLRDLLAMLQERADYKEQYTKCVAAANEEFQHGGRLDYLLQLGKSCTLHGPKAAGDEIERLKQQLHDQRWRRLSSEMPSEFPIQMQERGSPPFSIYSQSAMPPTKTTVDWWWRPIPPLPKE